MYSECAICDGVYRDVGNQPSVEMFAIDDSCWIRNDPVMSFANVDSDWWMDLAVWIIITEDKKESSTYFWSCLEFS